MVGMSEVGLNNNDDNNSRERNNTCLGVKTLADSREKPGQADFIQ